jgi:5-methylcytosine-specific restriction endonuclease McrA
MKKQCTKCKLEKDISDFFKGKRAKGGICSACKDCYGEYSKKWNLKNKSKRKAWKKVWKLKNQEYLKEYSKKWKIENKSKIDSWKLENQEYMKKYHRKYDKKRMEIPKNRLNRNVGCLTCLALKGKKAGISWQKMIGYSIDDLIRHLEKQFDSNMTWENYGIYWHLDHIKPRSLFKFETPEDIEFKKCWALENLQPLEAKENRIKSNKFNPPPIIK